MSHSNEHFRFAFLADTQLGCFASFSGFTAGEVEEYASRGLRVDPVPKVEGYEWDADRYRRAVVAINQLRPDLVVIGGDLIDDPGNDDQIDAFLEISWGIDEAIPVRFVPGNHDIAPDTFTPTSDSIKTYRAIFGADYYSFRMGNVVFIAINTTVIDRPENVPDELEEQMRFLEDELAAARKSDADEVILVGHHPLFVEHPNEPDTVWNLPTERRLPILDLLNSAGVHYGFAGHWHRNAIAVDRQFTQVTSGPVGYPLGSDPSGFRLVDVGPDGVSHEYHALDTSHALEHD